MKLKRQSLNVRHSVKFQRMASGLAAQSGQLLEAVVDRLAAQYSLAPQDIAIRTGATLEDWSLRIALFNRLGTITIGVEGVQASFNRLTTDADLAVVTDVQTRLLEAISSHSPTLKAVYEGIAGEVTYLAVGGEAARAQYFSSLSFPGKSDAHNDIGFKTRMRHPRQDVTALFEVEPVWANTSEVLFRFDADASRLESAEFSKRTEIVNELVWMALKSFDFAVEDAPP